MKIISWNVRGLGSFEKRREVCHLVREKKPFILCVQETKMSVIDMNLCKSIWGGDLVDFSFQLSVGGFRRYSYDVGYQRGRSVVLYVF